jgi:BirA family transcriptional regulator, biotin operon repressor / biotin---[acetyl-CoA-carboxylase] ligase
MNPGVYILGSGAPDSTSSLDPDLLAAAHPVWEKEVLRFGPWRREIRGFVAGEPAILWRADGYSGSSAVLIVGRTASSMDVAWKLVSENLLPSWGSVLAVEQSQGRGRTRRRWISPPGNVYGGWYWPRAAWPDSPNRPRPGFASLLAGELLAACLEEKGLPVRIKWPNDIVVADRKIGGILVEDRGDDRIVGVGVNLVAAPPDSRLRDDFSLPAACAEVAGADKLAPLGLWLRFVDHGRARFEELVSCLSSADFAKIFERRLAWMGEKILLRTTGEDPIAARIIGLAEDGGLRVRRSGKETVIYSGTPVPDF